MEHLPLNLVFQIFTHLSLEDIILICCQNKYLYQKVCLNDDFWQKIYLRDFNSPEEIPLVWREAYYQEKYSRVYSFGQGTYGKLGFGNQTHQNIPKMIPLPKDQNKMKSILARGDYSLILSDNGKGQVYAFGNGYNGQLGLGNNNDVSIPTPIPFPEGITQFQRIFGGGDFIFLLTQEGDVYTCGSNTIYQLGLNHDHDKYVLTRNPFLQNIKQCSGGAEHSLFLVGGEVYVCGWNGLGQLGLGDDQEREIPTLIPNLPKMKQISAGYNFSLILSDDGQVYAFGNNSEGQLGLGDYDNRSIPTLIPNIPKIKSISAGKEHSLILTERGQVYSFGSNEYGQLGIEKLLFTKTPSHIPLPKGVTKIKDISAGSYHNLILDEGEGQVYSFGDNASGQLGLGHFNSQFIPMLIPNLPPVKKISGGSYHNLILTESWTLFSTFQTLLDRKQISKSKILRRYKNDEVLMKFWDIRGKTYRIKVKRDSITKEISPTS